MTTFRCDCGAHLRYRQDMQAQGDGVSPTWVCADCKTPVPPTTAQRLRHEHPS